MKDFLIVGAGLFGSVFARLAADNDFSVTVIDKRDHIGGNIYTKRENNIDIHYYGPHIFHTNSDSIWNFVNRYTEFNQYHHSPKVRNGDNIYSFPINLLTLNQLFGSVTPEEGKQALEEERIKDIDPESNFENYCLFHVGRRVYSTFFYGYTLKQWGKHPKDLPASIIKRLPIRYSFNDSYYKDKYQAIPKNGYTDLINNLLDGIDVKLGVDFLSDKLLFEKTHKIIVYTGAIDRLFDYKLGKLEWRSLKFEHQWLNQEDYQGCSVVNYTDIETPFTRITEHKHFNTNQSNKTIITREYPDDYSEGKEQYYSVNNNLNNELYKKYLTMLPSNYIIGGRLGSYQYYDMDQIIGMALTKFKNL